ncbi:MAG: ribonuclease H [Planctomycetota bacterium]|nr:ribonuclease H [Planctomycetota bacterium]
MAWERRRYRGNKVWIDVDDAGEPRLDDRGLAALRYKPEDERTYTVRPDEILPLEPPPADPATSTPTPTSGAPSTAQEAPPSAPAAEPAPITIHTDGASSGNPGPAGLGVVLEWRGRRREIRRYLGEATNNEAELAAVLVALEAVKRPGLPVRIHTDSEYVIGVLVGGHRVKANVELVGRIQEAMARFGDLEFVKVPAHAGVPENERADALAREAIRERGPLT